MEFYILSNPPPILHTEILQRRTTTTREDILVEEHNSGYYHYNEKSICSFCRDTLVIENQEMNALYNNGGATAVYHHHTIVKLNCGHLFHEMCCRQFCDIGFNLKDGYYLRSDSVRKEGCHPLLSNGHCSECFVGVSKMELFSSYSKTPMATIHI